VTERITLEGFLEMHEYRQQWKIKSSHTWGTKLYTGMACSYAEGDELVEEVESIRMVSCYSSARQGSLDRTRGRSELRAERSWVSPKG
jgi:hypothetical protein